MKSECHEVIIRWKNEHQDDRLQLVESDISKINAKAGL